MGGHWISTLVVDDEDNVRTLVKRYLEGHGHNVFTASSVAEAREFLNALAFDIVITDIMMPGESGFDLIAHIRSRRPNARIVAMTGRSTGSIGPKLSAANCTVDGFIEKPFHPETLSGVVNNCLPQRELTADSTAG
jgi:two-component system phosphate regulon response regulator OmpR